MPKFILQFLLLISVMLNMALYFGRMDLGQYKHGVNKAFGTLNEIYQDSATQNFLGMAKGKLLDNYKQDIDGLKNKLQNQAKDQVVLYLKTQFPLLNDQEVIAIAGYIKGEVKALSGANQNQTNKSQPTNKINNK